MLRAGRALIHSEYLKPAESEWERKAAHGNEGAMRDFKRDAGGDNGRDAGRKSPNKRLPVSQSISDGLFTEDCLKPIKLVMGQTF